MQLSALRAIVCVAAFLPIANAQAADLLAPPTAPPQYAAMRQPPPSRQLECYAGVLGEGVDSHPTFYNVPISGVNADAFADGARGGLLGGCDVVFASHAFLGMDTSAVYGEVRGSHLGYSFNMPFEWDTRVRLGYLLDPQVDVYVAGGAEYAYRTTTSPVGVIDDDFDWGGQVAVGIEYEFAPNWRVRGEYAFTWPGLSGVSFPGAPFAQWAPSENLIRLAIMRVFSF